MLHWRGKSCVQASRGVVLAAVHACGEALRWASVELRADAEVVTVAAADSCKALDYADVSLLSNLGFMSLMVGMSGYSLRFATPELRRNRRLVQVAVRQSGVALAYAGGGLWAEVGRRLGGGWAEVGRRLVGGGWEEVGRIYFSSLSYPPSFPPCTTTCLPTTPLFRAHDMEHL